MLRSISRAACSAHRRIKAGSLHSSAGKAATQIDAPHPPKSLTPAQHAFVARTGFSFPEETLLQALTHKSYQTGNVANCERLEFLGQQALNIFVTEYIHSKYPNIPADALRGAVTAYTSSKALESLARTFGVQDVMLWTSADGKGSGAASVSVKVMKALIGGLYHDKGSVAARKFIHQALLSREVDMTAIVNLKEPKRMLSALMRRQRRERPVSRMLHETGRNSAAPVFVVGVFAGTTKLGEAAGSSIKMAEHRAAKDALLKHFLEQISKPLLPSDVEGLPEEEQLSFIGSKLGDTAPIV